MAAPEVCDPRVKALLEEQEREEKAVEAKARERRVRMAYYSIFSCPDGETVLADLREAFMDRSSVVPGDPFGTHFHEGERSVILRILRILREEAERDPREVEQSTADH